MAELLSSTMGPRIKVVVDVRDHLPPARADANQLEMAILNLSVNARDAMANGGVLRLCAGRLSRKGASTFKRWPEGRSSDYGSSDARKNWG
jgi:signal transduction histidine kinase